MDEYELEQVKREIVESRALTIKTNNLVNALAADLKSISKRQQGSERRVLVTSATGYVVTIGIILVFVKLAWDIRIETVRGENRETRDQLDYWEAQDALAVEMQAASLFGFAMARGAAVAVVALVSNSVDQTASGFDTGGNQFRVDVLTAIARAAARYLEKD